MQDHEAHLRHRRPSERGLNRALRQHHERSDQSRQGTDHDEHSKRQRGEQHDVGKADQQEAAGIDHARMEKRRNGGGGFHDLGQPAVEGKLRRLQHRAEREKRGSDGDAGWCNAAARAVQNDGDIAGAVAEDEDGGSTDEGRIRNAGKDELLTGGALCGRPFRIKNQEMMQAHAGGDERKDEDEERAGRYQKGHRGERRRHPGRERTLPHFAVQIVGAVACDDPADEGDQKQHDGADEVGTDRQQERPAAERKRSFTAQHEHQRIDDRKGKCKKGQKANDREDGTWAKAGTAGGNDRGESVGERGKERQGIEHGNPRLDVVRDLARLVT